MFDRKKALELVQSSAWLIDTLSLLAMTALFLTYVSKETFTPSAATGGDMGSHYWPLYTLTHFGFPHGLLRYWNPGNLGGEAHFVHYFPLPFWFMSLISLFTSLGSAFKIGILLPLLFFPHSVYYALRGLGLKFPAPILATAVSLCFLYNESYNFYGGNGLSTMAGQFAHAYAIMFLFLWVGTLGWEIRNKKTPFFSVLLFSSVALSHGYLFLGLPFFCLAFLFFYPHLSIQERLKTVLISAGTGTLLSLWFLVPMITSKKWTTLYNIRFFLRDALPDSFSKIHIPIGVILVLGLSLTILFKLIKKIKHSLFFWLTPFLGYLFYYIIAEPMGVVNIRAVPQMELFLMIIAGIFLSTLIQRFLGLLGAWVVTFPFTLVCIYWVSLFCINFPSWQEWNFGGWDNKPMYASVKGIMDAVKGDFSQPRVIYEHNDINNGAGTVRVFEMIPFFSGRATLESVYHHFNILAAEVFNIQALVSKTPSCPFWDLECPHYNLDVAKPKLDLMGVGQLITVTDEVKNQAAHSKYYTAGKVFKPWQLYNLKDTKPLVEQFEKQPDVMPEMVMGRAGPKETPGSGWKGLFNWWFNRYDGTQPLIIVNPPKNFSWSFNPLCKPTVRVDFNEIRLTTPCPGVPLFLKFAFDPSFKSDSGDTLFLVSPGFIGLTPSQKEVTLRYGQRTSWYLATWISIFTFLILITSTVFLRRKKI